MELIATELTLAEGGLAQARLLVESARLLRDRSQERRAVPCWAWEAAKLSIRVVWVGLTTASKTKREMCC